VLVDAEKYKVSGQADLHLVLPCATSLCSETFFIHPYSTTFLKECSKITDMYVPNLSARYSSAGKTGTDEIFKDGGNMLYCQTRLSNIYINNKAYKSAPGNDVDPGHTLIVKGDNVSCACKVSPGIRHYFKNNDITSYVKGLFYGTDDISAIYINNGVFSSIYDGKLVVDTATSSHLHFVVEDKTNVYDLDPYINNLTSLRTIHSDAFMRHLTNVHFISNDYVTDLETGAFQGFRINYYHRVASQPGLSVCFKNVRRVENGVFSDSDSVYVDIPNALYLGNRNFSRNSPIEDATHGFQYFNMPKLTEIGEGVFENRNMVTELNLSSVEKCGALAFDNCKKLSSLNLDSCTSWGENMFRYASLSCAEGDLYCKAMTRSQMAAISDDICLPAHWRLHCKDD